MTLRQHYWQCHANAKREGFPHFAHAIACCYFVEFGEAMPPLTVFPAPADRKPDALGQKTK